MTVVPAAPASTDALRDTVTKLLDEALNGPELSGLTESVTAFGVTIEMAASRGWGLRLTRKFPDLRVESRHLVGDDLTLDEAAAAYAELLQLT